MKFEYICRRIGDKARSVRISGAKTIKKLRTERGLTQKVFAETMSVSTILVKFWESGLKKPMGPSAILLNIYKSNPELLERRMDLQDINDVMIYEVSEAVDTRFPEIGGPPDVQSWIDNKTLNGVKYDSQSQRDNAASYIERLNKSKHGNDRYQI